MVRVAAYLDGFNIYNGMMDKGWGRYRWLDYHALMARYLRGEQHLVGVKYFTSRMTHQPDKWNRQQQYLRALEVRGQVEILAGEFQKKPMRCPKCEKWFKVWQEKKTDVQLATHLVADACQDAFDTFILCTADSDLVPAAEYVKRRLGKWFILVDPPRRHSDDLADLADQHLHSREHFYRQSQLPDPVEHPTPRGRIARIHRPPLWTTRDPGDASAAVDDGEIDLCFRCRQPLPV